MGTAVLSSTKNTFSLARCNFSCFYCPSSICFTFLVVVRLWNQRPQCSRTSICTITIIPQRCNNH